MPPSAIAVMIPADLSEAVKAAVVTSGLQSEQDVVNVALQAWLDREQTLQALDAAIELGIADADAGRVHSVEDVRAELHARFDTGKTQAA